jgi:hypothetical protein
MYTTDYHTYSTTFFSAFVSTSVVHLGSSAHHLHYLHRRYTVPSDNLSQAREHTRVRRWGKKCTYNGAYRVLLSWGGLLQSVVDDKVEKDVIASEDATDFPPRLEVDEELLVHELEARGERGRREKTNKYLFQLWLGSLGHVGGWQVAGREYGLSALRVFAVCLYLATGEQ